MKRAVTSTFCLTMPLRYEIWQRDRLDKIFKVAGGLYNNLVSDRKKALAQIERTRQWKSIQKSLSDLYQAPVTKEQKTRILELYKCRKAILDQAGMREYDFHARIQKWRAHVSVLVGTHVAQKIASAVWRKFEDYLYGSGENIKFKPWQDFLSIEGKNNQANIRYKDGTLFVGKMSIPVTSPRNAYETEALQRRVKYCRIVRLPWKSGWLYKLQLVLEGEAPIKKDAAGERLYALGKGRAGIDIGTQTIAFSSASKVSLEELANKANLPYKKLCRINRAIDRSRRAMNSHFFRKDGTVIPINQLPLECLNRYGRRRWNESKGYRRLAQRRRYLYAKLSRIRRCQHQALANQLIQQGSEFYVEGMRFQALAKRAKRQQPEDLKAGEKYKGRKRFGTSIANKAPAMFLDILEKKVTDQKGTLRRINTAKAKASQYNHINHEYHKKKLSQRWNSLPDGRQVQRDLYSAFLIMNVNEKLDGFNQQLCESTFENFYSLHNLEIERLKSISMPGSAGVKSAS